MKPIQVLMVEDNPGDVVLLREAAATAGLDYQITVLHDGVAANAYLHATGPYAGAPRPDLVVLDMKLPRRSGREVLEDIRGEPALHTLTLVALSSSRSELDLVRSNLLPTQTTMGKPSTFAGYIQVVKAIEVFRQAVARRDGGHRAGAAQ